MSGMATQQHHPTFEYYTVHGFYPGHSLFNLDVYRIWMFSELFRKEVLLQIETLELQVCKQIPAVRLTTGEVLLKARKVLGATVSDLADMLGVSRPTIYSYMDGNEPAGTMEQFQHRLSLLETTLDFVEELKLSTPAPRIVRKRNSEGKTFKELMKAGELDKGTIEAFCLSEAATQQQIRERLKKTGINLSKQTGSNPEDISVPLSRE